MRMTLNVDGVDVVIDSNELDLTKSHYFNTQTSLLTLNEPCPNALKALGTMAKEASLMSDVKDFIETVYKHISQEYELLVSTIMPKVMAEAGVAKFSTEDGKTVENKVQVFANLPKEDLLARERALKWINEQGGGGLIKDKLVVESPTQDLIDEVQGKFQMERLKDIHPQSLKAFMSDLLGYKKGSVARMTEEEIPPELHVFVKNTVSVK